MSFIADSFKPPCLLGYYPCLSNPSSKDCAVMDTCSKDLFFCKFAKLAYPDGTDISCKTSKVKVFVIPTDEERVFVEDVAGLMSGAYDIHTRFDYTFQHEGYRNSLRDDAFAKQCVKKPALLKVAASPL